LEKKADASLEVSIGFSSICIWFPLEKTIKDHWKRPLEVFHFETTQRSGAPSIAMESMPGTRLSEKGYG
jgi:hypothetical protein